MILTPITLNPGLAFLTSYRWDKHLTRARRQCRIELRRLTREIGQRYAQEQSPIIDKTGAHAWHF